MDNEICELFLSKKLILKKLETLDIKAYSKKRAYKVFLGVNTKGFYTIVFVRDAKSRFLLKELEELNLICQALEREREHAIKKRILFYNSPICSKAKNSEGWKFYDFV